MNKIPRITKCESIAKMTPDEVKIMILEKRIDKAIEFIEKINYINNQALPMCKEYKEVAFKSDMIEIDIKSMNRILSILRGEDNE